MDRFRYRNVLRLLPLLALGLTALPACGQILGVEADPVLVKPTCKGKLRVRITTDDSGTATDIAPPYNRGIYDYLRYLNDTNGGIAGCPIDIDMKDAHNDNATTGQVIDAWRAKPEWAEVSTVFVFGTGPATFVAAQLTTEKKLIIPGSYAGSLASPVPVEADVTYPEFNSVGHSMPKTEHRVSAGYPNVFFPATDHSTAIRIGIQAAWKIAPGTVAMVHDTADACPMCTDALAAGKSYVGQLPGMFLAGDLGDVPQTADPKQAQTIIDKVTAYMQKEIDQKKLDNTYVPVSWLWCANGIFSCSNVGKGAVAAQALIKAAFPDPNDQWQLRVMANNWGIGETTGTLCGPECANIYYGLSPVPRYGDVQSAPGMTQLLKVHDTYRKKDGDQPDAYRDIRYVQGYAAALMWEQAVDQAIATGHSTPTGEDLRDALESFDHVGLQGMTAVPISFSAADHRPQANESVYVLGSQGTLNYVDHYTIDLEPTWLGY